MPYSIDEVRRVTSECTTCAKIKPQFFNSPNNILIHSTAPFQRLSVDYKGPILISSSGCCYILTVVDEYSRFPFAFSCPDCSSQTVIQCLITIFFLSSDFPRLSIPTRELCLCRGNSNNSYCSLGLNPATLLLITQEGTANVSAITALYGTPFY